MAEDFFGDLSKSISSAAQTAATKTTTFIESQKKSVKIASAQREIEKLYQKIGEKIAEEAAEKDLAVSEDVRALLDEIAVRHGRIEELKKDIARIRGQKICPVCGFSMDLDALFCPQCGTRAPEEAPASEVSEEEEACCCCACDGAAEAPEAEAPAETASEEAEAPCCCESGETCCCSEEQEKA